MKKIFLIVCIIYGGFCAHAQPKLTLFFTNNTQVEYPISFLDSVTYFTTTSEQMKLHFNNGSPLVYATSTIDSITFDTTTQHFPDYATINSYFDRGFYSANSFQDLKMTKPSMQGVGVLAFPEVIEKKGKVLAFTTSDNSSFPVPGAVEGGVPLYSSQDGGYVHLFNGFNKTYVADNESPDLKPVIELCYVTRKYPTINYEQFHGGYGWLIYKFDGSGNAIIGILNENTSYKKGQGMFDDLEVVVLHEVYYADSTRAEIFITDHKGVAVSQGTTYNTKGGFIRQAAVGSGGHGENQDFFGMWYTLGRTLSPQQRADVANKLKAIYPIGKKPDLPYCNPVLKWNSVKGSFDLTINYAAGKLGLPIDPKKTIVRWYHGDEKKSTTGNMLDLQNLIRTTDGTILSLVRADYPTWFPSPYPSTNYINVGVTVFDAAGSSWREVPATPLQDSIK